jgi:hypothetical protein
MTESSLPAAAPAAAANANPVQTTPAPSVAAPTAAASASTGAVHSGIVIAQSPQAGRRVVQGDTVHVTLGHSAPPAAVPAATQ